MDNGGLVKQLLLTIGEGKTTQGSLTLLVDTIFMLGGCPCSAFMLTRKGEVWWDYLKGNKFSGNSLAAHEPYNLELETPLPERVWIHAGSSLKRFHPLDEETMIMLRLKGHDEKERTVLLTEIAEAALPVIAELHRARRREAAAKETSRVRLMTDVLLSVPDRDRALNLLAVSVSKCVSSERASVLALSGDREVLNLKAVYGRVPQPAAKSRPIRAGDGVAGWSMVNRKVVNIPDVRRDPRFIVTTCDDIRSMLCVPVCDSTEPIGVICAVNKRCSGYEGYKSFLDDDVEFLANVSRNLGGMLAGS